jgi:hypothetical protein
VQSATRHALIVFVEYARTGRRKQLASRLDAIVKKPTGKGKKKKQQDEEVRPAMAQCSNVKRRLTCSLCIFALCRTSR